MPNKSPRKFSREFKLEVVRRILAGEQIRALSEELTVLRKDLYAWRKLFRAGGAEASASDIWGVPGPNSRPEPRGDRPARLWRRDRTAQS